MHGHTEPPRSTTKANFQPCLPEWTTTVGLGDIDYQMMYAPGEWSYEQLSHGLLKRQ